jgi:hypothetical protein
MSKFSEMDITIEEATEVSRSAKMLGATITNGIDYGYLHEALSCTRQAGLTLREAAATIDILVKMIECLYEDDSTPTKAETVAKVRLTATVDIPWYMMDMKVSELAGTAGEDIYDI